MPFIPRVRIRSLNHRIPLTLAATATILVAVVVGLLSPSSALALTNGQALTAGFPRVASWWPDVKTPCTELAKLDYLVPYEWQPMSPDVTRISTIRAENPAETLFADASTNEINYRQPDSSGNPIGTAAYDAERIGAVPTAWILRQVGSTLSAPITTVSRPAQTISVSDATKFRVGDLALLDDEKCLVVSVGTGSLSVRRGWAGSSAVSHAAGARIAAAVSSWPYSVKLDLTDDCPLGRASGQIATPGAAGERARDWMVRRTAAHYAAAGWNGVAVDLGIGYLSWFKGTGAHQFRSIASRSNPDAEVDYTAFDAKWAASLRLFQTGLRSAVGPDAVILVNEATPEFDALNGSRLEGFPTKTTSSKTWYQRIIGPNKDCYYPSYLEWCQSARQPNFTTVETYGSAVSDYQLMRFGLTSALMGDGFYVYAVSNSPQLLRYDEYDNAGAGRGYLGAPVGPMRSVVTLSTPDLVAGVGGFSDSASLAAWTLYPRSGYAATKALDGGTAKLQVTQSAGSLDGILFYRSGVSVTSQSHYTLTFRARADRALSIQAQVQQAGSPYATYMASDAMPLTTSWRTFEIPMTSSGTDAAAQLKFLVGKSAGTVWIDDVKLQAGDKNVYRRDYEGGVALVNATESAVTVGLGGTFRKIRGTQAPLVNDGTTVTSVTIQPKDGLVLLRTTAVVAPKPDVTAPVTTASSWPTGWVKDDVTFSLVAADTDTPTGIATYYQFNTGAVTRYLAPAKVSTQGTTVVSYFSVDAIGNAETPHTASVRIDKTPPSTTDDHVATYTRAATIHLAPSDPISGVQSTRWELDGAQGSGTTVNTSTLGDHTLTYYSTDVAGNVESAHTLTFTVTAYDLAPPITTITGVPNGWSSGDLTLDLSAIDGDTPSGIATYYGINGPALNPYSTPITISAEGTTTIAYFSVDALGNAEESRTVDVRIDVEPPLTVDDHRSTYSALATVHLSPSDTLSGVARTTWVLDGTPGSGTTVTSSVLGTHTLTYRSADTAGNIEASHTVAFTVYSDQTALSLKSSAPKIKHGRTVTLSASVSSRSSLSGTLVSGSVVFERLVGKRWVKISKKRLAKAGSKARASIRWRPRKGKQKTRVRYLGGKYKAASTSRTLTIRVR